MIANQIIEKYFNYFNSCSGINSVDYQTIVNQYFYKALRPLGGEYTINKLIETYKNDFKIHINDTYTSYLNYFNTSGELLITFWSKTNDLVSEIDTTLNSSSEDSVLTRKTKCNFIGNYPELLNFLKI